MVIWLVICIVLGLIFHLLANYFQKKETKLIKSNQTYKASGTIESIEEDGSSIRYVVKFYVGRDEFKHTTIWYYCHDKVFKVGDKVEIEYYEDKSDHNEMVTSISDNEAVPVYREDGTMTPSFLEMASILFFIFAILIVLGKVLSFIEPTLKNMTENIDADVLEGILFFGMFGVIIIFGLLFARGVHKKGEVYTTKIIKKEFTHSKDHNDKTCSRYIFTIEHKGKLIYDEFEINDYSEKIKKDDFVEVRVYKNRFFFEEEYQDCMKKK